jgi:hypothetical protein
LLEIRYNEVEMTDKETDVLDVLVTKNPPKVKTVSRKANQEIDIT